VDEKYYIIGGTNFHDRMSQISDSDTKPKNVLDGLIGTGANDMDVVGRGEDLAKVIRREYFKLFAILEMKMGKSKKIENHYFPISKQCKIDSFEKHDRLNEKVEVKLAVGEEATKKNGCIEEFKRVLDSADKSIRIAHMYFDPQTEIHESLEKRVIEGVPVKIITNGVSKGTPIGNKSFAYAFQYYFSKLSKKSDKVELYTYNNEANIYHKKVVVCKNLDPDKSEVVIGSFNWGGKSHIDFEMTLTIRNKKVTSLFKEILKKDMDNSLPIKGELGTAYNVLGGIQSKLFPRFDA
jgi:phosphatidylserine/phosphatidylglycerophosphate/cardiolipin synthase-like enzyme